VDDSFESLNTLGLRLHAQLQGLNQLIRQLDNSVEIVVRSFDGGVQMTSMLPSSHGVEVTAHLLAINQAIRQIEMIGVSVDILMRTRDHRLELACSLSLELDNNKRALFHVTDDGIFHVT